MSYPTEQAAIESLVSDGFKVTESGYFAKRCTTQGNLIEAPRSCVALCSVVCHRVDPKWAAEGFDTSDYFTIKFH